MGNKNQLYTLNTGAQTEIFYPKKAEKIYFIILLLVKAIIQP